MSSVEHKLDDKSKTQPEVQPQTAQAVTNQPQVVISQPQTIQQQVTVVTGIQPVSGVKRMPQNIRDWDAGLFGCFADIPLFSHFHRNHILWNHILCLYRRWNVVPYI